MKFGQLIECNMRSIFLDKSYAKGVGGTIPTPISKRIFHEFQRAFIGGNKTTFFGKWDCNFDKK